MTRVHLFVGPTGYGIWDELRNDSELNLCPPVRRGDVQRLVGSREPGDLVICDGTFHHHPAVGHAELREALSASWRVWGLCSMGAIRAAEMKPWGMRGFGATYERFAADEDFTDDEVTLLHEEADPYEPISEPLVHLRAATCELVSTGSITPDRAAAIIAKLKSMWYAHRTLDRFLDLVHEFSPSSFAAAQALIETPTRFRTKTHELAAFIRIRPWKEETKCQS